MESSLRPNSNAHGHDLSHRQNASLMLRMFYFMLSWLRYISVLTLLISSIAAAARADDARSVDFNREIRPILSRNCFSCHGPDNEAREADLRLDDEASVKEDRGGYQVILPGEPGESELVRRITSDDEFERMPPVDSGKELTRSQIELLRRWVEEGAEWSRHWAYETPVRHPAPSVRRRDWPLNWVDRFVLSRLEKEGLDPSPAADDTTLLRRLRFDSTGLPPSIAELDEFTDLQNPRKYEQLVDKLLSTESFGERMAMYWLDLVRYADTVGYHGDQDHNISPYRDYVINAFNENKPFDQFTREQLAGDLIEGASVEEKIASGYNRLLQTSHEGGVQPKEYLAIYAADRVRNVSAVWLGGTLGCAQCHDHKFDPYTARDFYSMAAFFADIDEAKHFKIGTNDLPTARPPEMEVLAKHERQEAAFLETKIANLWQKLSMIEQKNSPAAKTIEDEISILQDQREELKKSARLTMVSASIEPRTMRILPRGNWLDDNGPEVQPAVPAFMGNIDVGDRRKTRLDLANWLTDAEAGIGLLTARVVVNRLWYLHFGSGLAGNLDDFGGQGEPPLQPELLDRLAHEFVESGWNIKHMVRLLVTSRTYRQSSLASPDAMSRDPDNRLYARQSRFRLPAEMIRDNALEISGLLVREVGGGSVKPYQPDGYYRHLNFPEREYEHHADTRQWRRGVYVHWQRQFLHPMLKSFDAPTREECTAKRARSNTPLAALTLLNDPTFVEASRVFAARTLRAGGHSDEQKLEFAVKLAVSRSPDESELGALKSLLASERRYFAKDSNAAKDLLSVGESPLPPGHDANELAAWTAVCRAVLNLNETYTRN